LRNIMSYSYAEDKRRNAKFEERMAAESAARRGLPRPPYHITYERYLATQELYPRVLVETNSDRNGNHIQFFRDVSYSADGPIICERNLGRIEGVYHPRPMTYGM
jgi:hypothetical protein